MRIREYTPADLDALKRLHAAQGFGYPFPDLDSPLLITKLVLEEDSGEISMAALLRLTAEAFLLHDPVAATPQERWQRLLTMHEAVRRDAAARGLDDAQAFLPPRVARAFGRRLARLGWRRDPWPCYCRSVKE
ncbi:MAG TPA: hypothetical protein VEH50_09970 [Methylomirabilota bacterium]|nr:hypothetical protein [Methylomirabilota bacterium]